MYLCKWNHPFHVTHIQTHFQSQTSFIHTLDFWVLKLMSKNVHKPRKFALGCASTSQNESRQFMPPVALRGWSPHFGGGWPSSSESVTVVKAKRRSRLNVASLVKPKPRSTSEGQPWIGWVGLARPGPKQDSLNAKSLQSRLLNLWVPAFVVTQLVAVQLCGGNNGENNHTIGRPKVN